MDRLTPPSALYTGSTIPAINKGRNAAREASRSTGGNKDDLEFFMMNT
jgi:hypothetical protein